MRNRKGFSLKHNSGREVRPQKDFRLGRGTCPRLNGLIERDWAWKKP